MALKETKVFLFSEKRKNMSWKTKGPEFGKLKVGFKEGWICRMMSPIVTHRIKGKTNEMLVASEAGKKPHVKCHTCVVIYTDPGRIRIQKECALQRVFTLGRNKRKWESKNPRQPFFFPPTNWKWRKSIISCVVSLCPQIFIEGQRQRCLMGYDYVKWSEKQCFITQTLSPVTVDYAH